jgi:hypothetical protein
VVKDAGFRRSYVSANPVTIEPLSMSFVRRVKMKSLRYIYYSRKDPERDGSDGTLEQLAK